MFDTLKPFHPDQCKQRERRTALIDWLVITCLHLGGRQYSCGYA